MDTISVAEVHTVIDRRKNIFFKGTIATRRSAGYEPGYLPTEHTGVPKQQFKMMPDPRVSPRTANNK